MTASTTGSGSTGLDGSGALGVAGTPFVSLASRSSSFALSASEAGS
jgi:hypothetical protein